MQTTPVTTARDLAHELDKIRANIAARLETVPPGRTVAMTYSGGRDSTVLLHAVAPLLARIVVIHVATGAALPEDAERIDIALESAPAVLRMRSDQADDIARNGCPSDIAPVMACAQAIASGAAPGPIPIQSTFSCCARNLWGPMQSAIIALRPAMLITGTRASEPLRSPCQPDTIDPITGAMHVAPLWDWTDEDIAETVRMRHLPVSPIYDLRPDGASVDCWSCTGYADELPARMVYLERFHPDKASALRERLQAIEATVDRKHQAWQRQIAITLDDTLS